MIKFGVIGTGIRGTTFSDVVKASPYAVMEAVCDANKNAAEAAGKRYDAKVFTDYQTMIEDCDLDAVIIATPDNLHYDAVIFAAEHGLNMLVEKPFSTSVAEGKKMADAIKAKGLKCMIAFENRWAMPFTAAKNTIEAGELGELLTINCRLNDTIFVPTKMLRWAASTTPAWFLFPHSVDLACWFGGKDAKKVYAAGTKKKLVSMGIDTYDSIQAVVTFTDDTTACFTTSWILPESMPLIYDFKFELIGDRSALYIDTQNQMVFHAGQTKVSNVHVLGTPVFGRPTSPAWFMMESFIDDLRNGAKPMANEDDALKNIAIVDAVHESLKSGQVIVLIP
jgi:predicted dehydrogenase